MRLRSIDITGFKSFRTRTRFEVDAGITAIVGPNGCGKSNLVDAIRWALGSQSPRDLRGRSMEDVIFAGSESHRPVGAAEVTLLFENADRDAPPPWSDVAELAVTRRLFRTGESEYEINSARCRLRDVHELFLGSGVGAREAYSIIEQGRVGFLVTARPEDRRAVLEEAAGVTRYRHQRRVALTRLEQTRANLERVGDVRGEVRRQLDALRRQAERLRSWRALTEEAVVIQGRVLHAETLALQSRDESLDRVRRPLQEDLGRLRREIAAQTADHERALVEVALREREADARRDEHLAADRDRLGLEGRLELADARLVDLRTDVERQRAAVLRLQQRLERADAEAREVERALQQARESADTRADASKRAESVVAGVERDASALESRWQEAVAAQAQARAELSTTSGARDAARRDADRAAQQREGATVRADSLAHATSALRARAEEAQRTVEEAAQRRIVCDERAAYCRQYVADLEARRVEALDASLAARSIRQEKERALDVLERSARARRARDGALPALDKARAAGELDVEPRPILPMLDIRTEPADVLLALGPWVDALLVDGDEARDAVLRWACEKGVRLTVASVEPAWRPNEGAAELADGVTASEPIPLALARRFQRDDATGTRPPGTARLDDGLFHVPGPTWEVQRAHLVERAERDALLEALPPLRDDDVERAEELQRIEEALAAAREERAAAEQELRRAVQRVELAMSDLRSAEADHQDHGRQVDHAAQEQREAHERWQRLVTLRDALETRWTEAQAAVVDAEGRVSPLSAAMEHHRAAMHEARQRRESAKVEAAREDERRRSLQADALRMEEERHSLLHDQDQAARRLDTAEREIEALESERVHVQEGLQAAVSTCERVRAAAEASRERQMEARRNAVGCEQRLGALRDRLEVLRAMAHEQQREEERIAAARTALEERRAAWVERRDSLGGGEDDASPRTAIVDTAEPSEAGESALRARLQQVEQKLTRLGPVHFEAEGELEQAEERDRYLDDQVEDLQAGVRDLEGAIRKLDRISRTRFVEMFEAVDRGFQVLVPRLFRGGAARLVLTEPDDPLESGVEILVQPPGKRLQSMSLLSGGEKALTAVALLFAIFQLRPTPFCVLDEVDAPLDDGNVARFADLVRDLAHESRFLVITHNRTTMRAADVLYGVTMEEPGVSRLVGVRVEGGDAGPRAS